MRLRDALEDFWSRLGFSCAVTPRDVARLGLLRPGQTISDGALEGFDWKFYLNFYPDLKHQGVVCKRLAIQHWLEHGLREGRLGGPRHRIFKVNRQILGNYLETVDERAGQAAALAERHSPLIHILTRSNRRPRFFHDNRLSVLKQTYPKWRQLVCYENAETLKYLQREKIAETDLFPVRNDRTKGTHPYNLFVNELMAQVADGWIMFLDDDDLFTTQHALSNIASHLDDPDKLLIWRAWFPDKNVPGVTDVEKIAPGGITSCCFAFHSKHKLKAQWHAQKAGDYHCFDQLRRFLKPEFLNDVLTRVNYTDCSAGWGESRDKH